MSEIFSGTNQTDPRADGESLTYVFDYTSGARACVRDYRKTTRGEVNKLIAAALGAAETAAAIAAIVIGVAAAELTLAKRVSLVEDAE